MRYLNYEGRFCYIDLKICVGRLAAPTIAKGGLYSKLLREAGGATKPRCKVLECNNSTWKVQFDNGVEGYIPKSHLLDVPPGTTFI